MNLYTNDIVIETNPDFFNIPENHNFHNQKARLYMAIDKVSFPFVLDDEGLHAMARNYHVWLFVNDETLEFDVTVDAIKEKETVNVEWESYDTPEKALKAFDFYFRKYLNS